MPVADKKRYQNTTVRMPRHVYERAKSAIRRAQAASFNDFVVQAIEEKVSRLSEAEIDAAFAHMAEDSGYQRDSIMLAREFEMSDWEALEPALESATRKPHGNVRTSKARSR